MREKLVALLRRAACSLCSAAPPAVNMMHLLHRSRSAFLRQAPQGANIVVGVGCADREYFDWFEACYGPVTEHIGIELYAPRPKQLPSYAKWIAASAARMDGIPSGACDLMFCGQNIEHLWPDEIASFLLEAWRTVRPGGYLLVDSPNRPITAALNWVMGQHTIEFSVAEARELISLAGFDIVGVNGIWLCRDARTGRLLHFDANVPDPDWSVTERLISAVPDPSNSFIWWLVATRSHRAPNVERLNARVSEIFDVAWPERLHQFRTEIGAHHHRADGDWYVCDAGAKGLLLYGPFTPLKAGRYRVTFCVRTTDARSNNADIARCEVVTFPTDPPLASRECRKSDLERGPDIKLDFELTRTTFEIQFRCISYGKASLECKRSVELTPIA